MRKKDYEVIARGLEKAKREIELDGGMKAWEISLTQISHELFRDNPNFDYETFYKACGY